MADDQADHSDLSDSDQDEDSSQSETIAHQDLQRFLTD